MCNLTSVTLSQASTNKSRNVLFGLISYGWGPPGVGNILCYEQGEGRTHKQGIFSPYSVCSVLWYSQRWHLSALQVLLNLLTSLGCIYCAWLIKYNPGHGNQRGIQRPSCTVAQSLLFCSVLLGTVGDMRITHLSVIKSNPCKLLLAIKALCNVQ